MVGFGKLSISSLLVSGALALPWAQTLNNQVTKEDTNGLTTDQTKQSSVDNKVGLDVPIPPVSPVGPPYSLLLAKEVSPTDIDGVIVAWAFGVPFCTQRQVLSENIQDICNKNLTFDRVPKLDDKLQATDQVTQISGYFAGCSDDVSLSRSYAGLYWVESVGMYDGVGDKHLSEVGTDATIKKTDTLQGNDQTQDTTRSTGKNDENGNTVDKSQNQGQGKAFRCNNDREVHQCLREADSGVNLMAFASCGQYAYTAGVDTTQATTDDNDIAASLPVDGKTGDATKLSADGKAGDATKLAVDGKTGDATKLAADGKTGDATKLAADGKTGDATKLAADGKTGDATKLAADGKTGDATKLAADGKTGDATNLPVDDNKSAAEPPKGLPQDPNDRKII